MRVVLVRDGALFVERGAADAVLEGLAAARPGQRGGGPDLSDVAARVVVRDVAVWTLTDGRGPTSAPATGALDVVGDGALPNRAIAVTSIEDRWPLAEVRVTVEVRTHPAIDEFPGVLVEGGGSIDPLVVRPLGGGGWRVDVRMQRGAGGAVRFTLPTGTPDALALDDAATVVLPPPPAPVVGVMRAGAADDADWVARAAAVIAELGQGKVVEASPGDRVGILLVDGGALPEPIARSMTFGTAFGAASEQLAVPVTSWDRAHPLTAGLDLSELVVRRAVGDLPAGGTSLVDGPEGPLLVAVDRDGARSLHLAFRLEDSNLPLLAAFPQLLRRAFVWVHAEHAAARVEPGPDPRESDLRRGESTRDRGLPRFGADGASLAVPLLLAALLLLAVRTHAR